MTRSIVADAKAIGSFSARAASLVARPFRALGAVLAAVKRTPDEIVADLESFWPLRHAARRESVPPAASSDPALTLKIPSA